MDYSVKVGREEPKGSEASSAIWHRRPRCWGTRISASLSGGGACVCSMLLSAFGCRLAAPQVTVSCMVGTPTSKKERHLNKQQGR